jgi:hypothetical protein
LREGNTIERGSSGSPVFVNRWKLFWDLAGPDGRQVARTVTPDSEDGDSDIISRSLMGVAAYCSGLHSHGPYCVVLPAAQFGSWQTAGSRAGPTLRKDAAVRRGAGNRYLSAKMGSDANDIPERRE